MIKTVHKFFSIGSFEKEEQWLNAMSQKGYQLVHVGWCSYTFLEGEPGKYLYRLELLEEVPEHPESAAYIRFMEETGAEMVASYMRWVYFRKKAKDGAFDLYSDIRSKIGHYRRIAGLWWVLLFVELIALAINVAGTVNYVITNGRLLNPNFFLSLFCLLLLGFVLCIGLPVLKKLRQMKKEQRVRE